MSSREHRAPTVAAALTFLLAGGALLLQELDALSVGWGVVLPLVLVVVGVVTVAAGLADAHRHARDARASADVGPPR